MTDTEGVGSPRHITDALLDELSFVGDPAADEVVAKHAKCQTADDPASLVGGIAAHLELPPERRSPPIDAYLADVPPLPDWADPALIERSASFFDSRGVTIGSALFCASLPEAYAAARGARVLMLTAEMVTDPVRRINETAQMVFDTVSRGGLAPGAGRGYQDIRRVRLMHAAVRYLIEHDPTVQQTTVEAPGRSWNVTAGVPLNQEDLLGTLLSFSTVVLDTLDRQGIGYERADAEAYLHTWCVAAALLGIRPDLLPIGLDDARELQALIRRRQHRPSDDALVLGRALTGALERSMPPLLHSLPRTLVTWYCGPEIARINGVTSPGWTRILVWPLRRAVRHVGQAENHHRIVRAFMSWVTVRILRTYLVANRSGDRPPFTLPQELDQRVAHPRRRWRFL
ncbi:MAG TPA: oxygenase MpaB family protein [Acidimicrobiales bacterium]